MTITTILLLIGATWFAIGIVLAMVMGRRGYDPFVWWLLGTVLGPLAMVLAVVSARRRQHRPLVHQGVPASGPVDVVVGVDGSAHAVVALQAALDLLDGRLGRLALATVLPLDDSMQRRLDRSAARQRLEDVGATLLRAGREVHPRPVLLSGRPADELERLAMDEGYDLLVVGARGAGLSTALLGSTATVLAARGRVPVLVAGGDAATTSLPTARRGLYHIVT